MELIDAAKSLKNEVGDRGFVGVGLGRIFVYVYAPKRKWYGDVPKTWEGHPVHWEFGVGRIVAA